MAPAKPGDVLKAKGVGSRAELERVQTTLPDGAERERFVQAFNQVFARDRSQRNPRAAKQILEELRAAHPNVAAIYRVLGYAHVDDGFQVKEAMAAYAKAIELAPDYGEVHYALAFMYGMMDREKGAPHYRKAVDLGVFDERGIGARFYPAEVQKKAEPPTKP